MATDAEQSSDTNLLVHYLDLGEYFSIYGIVTLIVLLLLLWYFVRTNLEDNRKCRRCHRRRCRCNLDGFKKSYVDVDVSMPGREGMFNFEDSAVLATLPEFNQPEPEPIKMTPDGEEPEYRLQKGMYGDVPMHVWDIADRKYGPEWYNGNTTMYQPNWRTSFRLSENQQDTYMWDSTPTHYAKLSSDDPEFDGYDIPGEPIITDDSKIDAMTARNPMNRAHERFHPRHWRHRRHRHARPVILPRVNYTAGQIDLLPADDEPDVINNVIVLGAYADNDEGLKEMKKDGFMK